MPNEHAVRRMLKNHLVDVEVAHRNSVSAEKQILELAESRAEVVEREIERLRPLSLADDAAGDRYMELVNERGRLANVMALARRHLGKGWD